MGRVVNRMRAVHPGEVLREEYLAQLSLSVNALAMALGVPATRIHEIVKERRGITADTAERLARYFGGDAASWLALQADRGRWSQESIDLDRSRKVSFRRTARKPAPMLVPGRLTAKVTAKSLSGSGKHHKHQRLTTLVDDRVGVGGTEPLGPTGCSLRTQPRLDTEDHRSALAFAWIARHRSSNASKGSASSKNRPSSTICR